ncbi:tetrapyrrole methylase [Aureococcus anophagefferens]|nr:tetrapyrrole methylase [Aureococcus anophagefferens]
MPGVWLLDETYDYDAASQNFATHAAEARRQESGSAPGIRVTKATASEGPPRRRRPADDSPQSTSRDFAKLDTAVDPTTKALGRRWDPHAHARPHTSDGYERRRALNAGDVQLKLRPETAVAGVGGRRRIEVARPRFRPPRLAEQDRPPVAVAPAWAEYVEPPREHPGHGAPPSAGAARADALQSQWLANLPRHLPTSNHWRKASALDDPTSGVFWSGSLHTPAVRAFMTPTVVHRTRSNALRKVVLVYARLERRRERYAAAREPSWLARVDGGGDGAAHGAAAALCAYHCGDYAGAIALAGADAALAHRFYLFHASAAPEGLALRRRAAETAAAKLRRTLRSAYDDVRVDDGQVVLAWLRSPGLGVLGPNPVIFDDAAIHCGRRGEGRGATRVDPRDYAPERAAPEPVILVPASKPGNYYHCLLEFLARVARAASAGVLPRGATLLVPANQCLALYAEALALLRVERWRPVDLTKALALPAGAWAAAPRYTWVAFDDAPRSLAAQIALFGAAGLVVGAHGAGLANLVFAAEGCRVLEFPVVGRANRTYEWLARALGHAYAAADAEATFTGALDLDDAAVADAAA